MLKNYFNIAFRNLIKHKFYSLINVLGLSVGLMCFLQITLFVKDEMTYDNYQTDIDQVFRMDFTGNINGSEFVTALASAPAAAAMVRDFPEVEEAIRFRETGNWILKKNGSEDAFNVEDVVYVDHNFFSFFDISLIAGDPLTCLKRPNTLVLSKKEAEKIFGQGEVVGQVVKLDNDKEMEVTGVFEIPRNAHFNFDMMFSMEHLEEAKSKMWLGFNFNTYLKLKEGADADALTAKLPDVVQTYIGPEISQYMNTSMEDFLAAGNALGFSLFPMKDIYLKSQKLGEFQLNGDIKYVYIFTAIAAFILALACINFMNLSTARSAGRAKEVGVRKVMGAQKPQLIGQFLAEAMLITLASILLAYVLSFAALPYFNKLAGRSIELAQLFSVEFFAMMVGILVIVGLLAGSYPAFYLSKFRPVETLKGKLKSGMKASGIRSTLVVLQFCVSIMMMIGTAIVFQQLSYIQNKKLGWSKEHIVMIHDPWMMGDKAEAYKNEALQYADILSGTMSSFLPVNTSNNNNAWFPGTSPVQQQTFVFHQYRVDHDYLETLGLELTEGRSFSKDFPSDSSAVLINETAMAMLGWNEAVGKTISTFDDDEDSTFYASYKIVGVLEDFHFTSLKNRIEPLVFQLGKSKGYVSFKISAENIEKTLDFLEDQWHAFAPGQPFAYSFLDDRFDEMYRSEQKLGEIFGVFAFLAIFIACLGLYGLAAFTAEQRKKEIGVRKVLGASIFSIITLLSKEFLKLVLISFTIGSVAAGFLMNKWLQDFENRTQIDVLVFILAGTVSLMIAWVTMGFQSWNAARVNPARSLKDE